MSGRAVGVRARTDVLSDADVEPAGLVTEPADAGHFERARLFLGDRLDDPRNHPALEMTERPPHATHSGAGHAFVDVDAQLRRRELRHLDDADLELRAEREKILELGDAEGEPQLFAGYVGGAGSA